MLLIFLFQSYKLKKSEIVCPVLIRSFLESFVSGSPLEGILSISVFFLLLAICTIFADTIFKQWISLSVVCSRWVAGPGHPTHPGFSSWGGVRPTLATHPATHPGDPPLATQGKTGTKRIV